MNSSSDLEVLTGMQHTAASPIEDNDMLEKQRLRALRRKAERKVQKRRIKNHRWLKESDDERLLGRLRHNHFGCGCTVCKPWKHRAGRKWASWDRQEYVEDLEY